MNETPLPSIKDFKLTGIILCVIGVLSLMMPLITGIAVVMMIGFLLLLGGVLYVVQGTRISDTPGKTQHILLGALMILGGIGVVSNELFVLSFLTILMAIFFIFEGTWKIVMAMSIQPDQGRNSILFSGVISLLLGALIGSEWPLSGTWAVGTLLGVDFLLTGFFLINIAGTQKPGEPETIETTTTDT